MNLDAPASWVKALGITFVCLSLVAMALAAAYAVALFYLYSFHRDPKRWTNVSVFYARPNDIFAGRIAPEPARLGSLVVRGNNGTPAYASQYELSLGDIEPSTLHDCLLAAEDKRFYRHTGLDYVSLAKALYDHFVKGDRLRGGSTISNQLVRTVVLADQSRSLFRKIPEILLTIAAENHFFKDDLLLAYVNNVPVGHLDGRALIGLSAASEALFGKRDPKTLNLSEACTIAGILNRPNGYLKEAVKGDYSSIVKRRNTVLENLGRSNPDRYAGEAIQRAKREEVRFFKNSKKAAPEHRQFISYAYPQLRTRKPGLRVYLTLDPDLQRAAEAAVNENLAGFDKGPYGFYNRLSYERAVNEGRKITKEEAMLQAALVTLDAKTGEILALVGGRSSTAEFNRATQAKRAPGSIVKPFIYLFATSSGSLIARPFGPDTIIDPARSPVAQRYSTGGAASATIQLARSDNGAAVAVASELGISRVRDFIAKVTGADPVESEQIAIGAGKGMELSPLELATAYTIFPNNGVKVAPNPFWAVYDNEAKIKTTEKKSVRLIDAEAPYIVTRMLQSVTGDGPDGQYGTARMARKLSGLEPSIALAGKTGTSDNDLWFVGFTPRMVVVVWVGFDNNFPSFEASKGFTGSGLPLQIWARFMRDVKKYRPYLLQGTFEVPSSVMELTIDPERGCLSQNGIK
jgi:penicillin-binding protein 1A